jgi:hypothetical protein
MFNGQIQATTTKETRFEPIEQIENVVTKAPTENSTKFVGSIPMNQMVSTRKCLHCYKIIDMGDTGTSIVKCTHCNT